MMDKTAAKPETTSVVIPAFDEGNIIGTVVSDLLSVGSWHEIIVVDDGSTDDTSQQAAKAGARVIRHPYNKGNGAAVKSGIRAAEAQYILILDGDGQHRPNDAPRLLSKLSSYELVIGARATSTQASLAVSYTHLTLPTILRV